MTAILSDSELPETLPAESERPSRVTDAIRREMLSLRARVRTLAEQHAGSAADGFTRGLQAVTVDVARAMDRECEDRAVLARLHLRLERRVNADLLRLRDDDELSIDARARELLVAQLGAVLEARRPAGGQKTSRFAHADFTPGTARAMRILEEHREEIRSRFRSMKARIQVELADLSLEMAGETAARLCLRHGQRGREWLWWRLSKIVDQLVAVSTPPSLPSSLELLATRSVLAGLETDRDL